MNARSADRRLHRRLFHLIQTHPRYIALMRLWLVLLALPALGYIGMRWSAAPPVVYDAQKNCEYSATTEEAPLHRYAAREETGHMFLLSWHINYTGSCEMSDIRLARRNTTIPSVQSSYLIDLTTVEGIHPRHEPVPIPPKDGDYSIILNVTTIMTAPSTAGVYVTEWQLYTPGGERFGPIISRRVQVYDQGTPPPDLTPDQVPPTLLHQLLTILVSFVFHLMPALIAIAFVLWRATDFMNRLFGLKSPATARRHVMSMMFGLMNSAVQVKNGKIDHEPENTAAEIIGGPAWLTVSDYSAAVLEHGGGFARIVGPGITYLPPHERVRGTIDLQTQHRTITERTMTKDGIPIELNVDLVFRITQKDMPGDVPPEKPGLGLITRLKHRLGWYVNPALLEASRAHRFSREAVRRAVYETTVFSPNRPPDWTISFSNVRAGDVSDQMAEKRLDELSAPEDPDLHPLREIVAKGLETARSFGTPQGIDVLDMTMGVIKLQKEYHEVVSEQKKEYRDPLFDGQIISNWQMEWTRRAEVLKAEGEAKKTQLVEEARAESQANMIQALTEGFRIATEGSDDKDVSHQVIALRFIDTLEALIQSGPEKGKESPDLTLTVS